MENERFTIGELTKISSKCNLHIGDTLIGQINKGDYHPTDYEFSFGWWNNFPNQFSLNKSHFSMLWYASK